MAILAKKAATKLELNNKLSIRKQYKFMYRLKQLLERNYNLHDAIEVISWDKELNAVVNSVRMSFFEGQSLAKALAKARFQTNIVHYLEISSQYGNITYGVKHCCYILKQQIDLIKRFKQLSTYPLLLFVFFILILYVLRTFIFPSFQSLLTAETSTASIFQTTSLIVDTFYYGILVTICFLILLAIFYPKIKHRFSIKQKIKLHSKIPLWRNYKKMQLTFLFTTHLSSLLHSGLNMKECFHILHQSNIEPIITHYVEIIDSHLIKGYEATSILPIFQLFEKDLQNIMQKDRNAKQLTEELQLYSEHLLTMMEELLQKWLKILQPILLTILALLIVFVYITMMLPMFDYIQTI
ncbi:type II secretion system F family protein [Gracilibacillus oryzae]|nr:type II secretion system F family protein [Gracilibacillus oryzae]